MTDTLLEQIKADRENGTHCLNIAPEAMPCIPGCPCDLEARILRDAETIKAAWDMEKVARAMARMIADSLIGTGQSNVAIRPDGALTLNDAFQYIAAFRAAQEKNDG